MRGRRRTRSATCFVDSQLRFSPTCPGTLEQTRARDRQSLAGSRGDRDGDQVTIAEAKLLPKPNLGEQLDLIGGISGLARLVRLECDAAMASGDEDGDME